MKPFYSLLIILSLAILASCRKDASSGRSPETTITQHSWKLSEQKRNTDNAGWIIDYSGGPHCILDNIITYYPDHTLVNTEGATRCNSSDPDVFSTAYWQITNSGNDSLSVFDNASMMRYRILQLDDTKLRLQWRMGGSGSPETIYEYSFIP